MEEGKQQYYTIGQMAELCNVSRKQLRYYDENGIISPAYKDEQTLYRYYTYTQMQEILLLKELKQVNLPLRDIAEIVKDRNIPLLRSKLAEYRETAKEDLVNAWERYNQVMNLYLRVSESAEVLERARVIQGEPHSEVFLTEYPVRRIVGNRYRGNYHASALFTNRRAEVYRILEEYHLNAKSSFAAIFHDGYMKQFSDTSQETVQETTDLETFVEVDNVKDCPYARNFGGFRAITSIHIGPYTEGIRTYQIMQKWAADRKIALSDTAIEEYLCGVTMTKDESRYVTRMYILLAGEASKA